MCHLSAWNELFGGLVSSHSLRAWHLQCQLQRFEVHGMCRWLIPRHAWCYIMQGVQRWQLLPARCRCRASVLWWKLLKQAQPCAPQQLHCVSVWLGVPHRINESNALSSRLVYSKRKPAGVQSVCGRFIHERFWQHLLLTMPGWRPVRRGLKRSAALSGWYTCQSDRPQLDRLPRISR